jgi:hypothetical protein
MYCPMQDGDDESPHQTLNCRCVENINMPNKSAYFAAWQFARIYNNTETSLLYSADISLSLHSYSADICLPSLIHV